ncbi:MAG: OB-fold protein [Cyclobacteriaceae bacterium]
MKRRLIGGIIAVFGAIAVLAFWLYTKPSRTADETPFVVLPAKELYKTFLTDEDAANGNYLNKVLEVYGEVADVGQDLQHHMVLLFNCDDPVFGVRCTLEKPVKVKPGDVVHIKGICKGFLSDVILTNCIPAKP